MEIHSLCLDSRNHIDKNIAFSIFLTHASQHTQTFNELDNLEIATGSDEESEQSPPPIPPRTSSVPGETRPPLPSDPFINNKCQLLQPICSLSPSESTSSSSSDTSDSIEDISEDSSGDDDDDTIEEDKMHSIGFDANSSLPPVPNGILDLTSPDKQKFSSDEERYEFFRDYNKWNALLEANSYFDPSLAGHN
jgi:hypothetical protein